MLYVLRTLIRRLPGVVIKAVPLPEPETVTGFASRARAGELCRRLGFKNVLLVTDETIFSLGLHEKLVSSLQEAGIAYTVFSAPVSEPNLAIIDGGRKALEENKAEAVIALGGGAVMDASKMIAAGGRMKKRSSKSLLQKFLFVPKKTLPILAVPTTAGTGAEMTVGAVVTNGKGAKCCCVVVGLDVCGIILDGELTQKAPKSITAACGIDALSHGLEGAVASIRVKEEDKKKSMECVRLVLENLPVLLKDPENRDARQKMCLAANLGGNAINKQLAGYVHAVAHSIGARFHIPHGNAIALALLPVMDLQKSRCLGKLAETARYCGLADESTDEAVACERLLGSIRGLIRACGFAEKKNFIEKEDYAPLARAVSWDSVNYSPPTVLSNKQIYAVLDAINEGKEE